MKTILLLNNKSGSDKPRLQNIANNKVTARPNEGRPGCNCDRWGHPCSDFVERNVQPNAAVPFSTRAEPKRSLNVVHQQA